ncbi:SdpI/YhfL protein family protein [Peptoclostridium litorale DSM 5388]|uniref:Uncharacterized protein n=1 Tax=Peptoclostridium litorale DSM 5388 TaxID=1121324 RepID=A0A069REX8_PEPLI|nr:SdpI family protein [Peptoclostridium litorale]KDR95584.1 hypothetical protein CLIT_10c03110 [Peptoclostridium litorale DSM 5388]SIN98803.1 SdpI/YhfL protein family protein [Peptoclostridium litorale DSM 5388]
MGRIGLILLVIWILGAYIKAPEILGLSKENPKVKTARCIQILFLIVILGRELSPVLGLDELFSNEINDKIIIGINAIVIMYFGNLLPKIQIYKNMETTNPWAIGDEKVWRKATKIFAYLSFLIAISMFVLSFYFDSAIVVQICQFIWFAIPLLYLLIHYNKKFKGIKTR